jgi:simple sugar transport system ATP-binding protein
VRGIDFEVREGEILGIAGVAGNGQDELVEALVGLRKPSAGRIVLGDRDITGNSPREVRRRKVAYVPADRQRYGLVLTYSLEDNLVLTRYSERPYARGILRNEREVERRGAELVERFDIRAPSAKVRASSLSGGNQQKVVVAREFADPTTLLVIDQPTRGVDVGSIEFIHKQVIGKRDARAAILLVSAELDEVLELSDRIAVIFGGRIVATFDAADADREKIGLLMARGEAGLPGRKTPAAVTASGGPAEGGA